MIFTLIFISLTVAERRTSSEIRAGDEDNKNSAFDKLNRALNKAEG